MSAILSYLFGAASFMPHGYCLLWRPDLVAMHAISDTLIAIAYFSIPVGLWSILRRILDAGFRRLFALFAAFILLCGLTHVVEVATLWWPVYGLLALVKAATAVVSLIAAYSLWPAIPRALAIPGLTELRSANRDVGRALVDRQELVSDLSAANRDLDDFANTVAHDLRSPLRSIHGFSQILADDHSGQLDASGQEMLDRIRKATLNMGGMIDSLLFLARLRQAPVNITETNLSAMARQIEMELRREHPEYNPEVVIQDGLWVECDASLMHIVLRHLMHNGWKFSSQQARPRVEMSWSRVNGRTRIVLRDNGVGFDMAYAEKIFFPFQRLHPVSEFPGTGIGLAAVTRALERQGGRIEVTSRPGEGTSFTITL